MHFARGNHFKNLTAKEDKELTKVVVGTNDITLVSMIVETPFEKIKIDQ